MMLESLENQSLENRSMPGALMARPLEREQIAQAFPVLQLALPQVALADWRRYAASLLGRSGETTAGRVSADTRAERISDETIAARIPRKGIMTVQNRRGYIQGLFCYREGKSLAHARQMVIEGLSALDLVPGQQAGAVLGRALTTLTRDLQCRAVYIHLPGSLIGQPQPRWLRDFFAATQAVPDEAIYHVAEAIGA